MNVFFLDRDPDLAAKYHADKHVVKMVLETAQILSTNTNIMGDCVDFGYGISYSNHPAVAWGRQSRSNWNWLRSLGLALCHEYTFRYERTHASQSIIIAAQCPIHMADHAGTITFPALCMPQIYKGPDPVESYRQYYIGEKHHLLKYTKREVPEWLSVLGLGEAK